VSGAKKWLGNCYYPGKKDDPVGRLGRAVLRDHLSCRINTLYDKENRCACGLKSQYCWRPWSCWGPSVVAAPRIRPKDPRKPFPPAEFRCVPRAGSPARERPYQRPWAGLGWCATTDPSGSFRASWRTKRWVGYPSLLRDLSLADQGGSRRSAKKMSKFPIINLDSAANALYNGVDSRASP